MSVAALLLLIAAGAGARTPGARQPTQGMARPVSRFWARRITGYLRTTDGVPLHYSVLLPAKTGRFPVALIDSGYDTGSIGGAAYLRGSVAFSASLDRALIEHGYAVMGVNARATGCSGGNHFTFLGPTYGLDGRDAVEFAAKQPWSDGRVGMYGWSWAGMSQLASAADRPPHLKAIAPGMVLGDFRLDNAAPGGVSQYYMAWAWRRALHRSWEAARESAQAEHDLRCLRHLKRNYRLEAQNSVPDNLLRHPLRDAWTERQRLSARTHLISVPVLSMESFQDQAVSSREGYYQETLDPERTWMLQTNGPHDLYESLRFRPVLVAFLDRFVKGVRNGFEMRPHLTVWMDTRSGGRGPDGYLEAATPRWEFTSSRLLPVVKPLALALTRGGRLVSEAYGSGEPDTYLYPVPGPAVDEDSDHPAWGALAPDWRQGSLAYTSAPLERAILAYGSASVDLWLSSNMPDTDLQVTLTEVRPDGQEMYLQRGWLRLSDRALDEARSAAVRPVLWDRPRSIQVLDAGVPVLARVEINKFAALLRRGSRIRVWIDAPSPTGFYRFDEVSLAAKNEIWHDKAHPSRVVIGELERPKLKVPQEAAPCGTSMMEPCRRDPLVDSPTLRMNRHAARLRSRSNRTPS
ncbi:MAG: CocE/NonD family hydrolase [Steroidobacteraceae bacterium]